MWKHTAEQNNTGDEKKNTKTNRREYELSVSGQKSYI